MTGTSLARESFRVRVGAIPWGIFGGVFRHAVQDYPERLKIAGQFCWIAEQLAIIIPLNSSKDSQNEDTAVSPTI
jgi:hypothetical protein